MVARRHYSSHLLIMKQSCVSMNKWSDFRVSKQSERSETSFDHFGYLAGIVMHSEESKHEKTFKNPVEMSSQQH